jgi:hypothetical protein
MSSLQRAKTKLEMSFAASSEILALRFISGITFSQ